MSVPHLSRQLLAGILSVPALLLLLSVAPLVALLSFPSLAILVRRKRNVFPSLPSPPSSDADGSHHPLLRHAIITGGSSGIGLAIAIELARRKCRHITLIARREGQLQDAKKLVQQGSSNATTVNIVSVDVTDFSALQKKAADLCSVVEENALSNGTQAAKAGPPTLLFNCAGYAIPLSFADLSPSDFAAQVNVNYLGSIHVVKAFLPYMLGTQQPNTGAKVGGNIILTSSMCGQLGTYGYSAYAPTKFALRGFAECMSMELDAAGKEANRVNISVCYPPDTKTPGYEVENEKKSEACRLISEGAGIWDPQDVGKRVVKEAISTNPPFDIYFGLEGWMLSTITGGMNPVTRAVDAICQVALMGLLRFVSLFYLMEFGRITQQCIDRKNEKKNGNDDFKTD